MLSTRVVSLGFLILDLFVSRYNNPFLYFLYIDAVEGYLLCVEKGQAACEKLSDFLRKSLLSQTP